MEIKNFSNVIGTYKANSTYNGAAAKQTEKPQTSKVRNTDVASFSAGSVDLAKAKAVEEVERDAPAERLAQLAEDLGSYYLPSDVLSKAIAGE